MIDAMLADWFSARLAFHADVAAASVMHIARRYRLGITADAGSIDARRRRGLRDFRNWAMKRGS